MKPLALVKIDRLMERTAGMAQIGIGLIDGPVAMSHPDLAGQHIRQIPGKQAAACSISSSVACIHGTFVAGMLLAKRGSNTPGICPECTLLVRPIFPEGASSNGDMPSAKPEELAEAIVETVDAGARVINLSAALVHPSSTGLRELEEALYHAGRRNVIVVAAAGNQAIMGSSAITRHPWVVPVTGCDQQGMPTAESNTGNCIGRNGLRAPATEITSLGTGNRPQTSGGTSAAAPFVTGAIALLWSEFPSASASDIRLALRGGDPSAKRTVVPPLLDAWAAYQALAASQGRKAS